MPTDCINKEKNEAHCVCTEKTCPRHGICCECIAAHRAAGKPVACMR